MSLNTQFVDYFTRVQASPGWDRVLASFARFLALDRSAHILDVGCGPGSLVRRLAREVTMAYGCDTDPNMIDQAQRLAAADNLANVEFRVDQLPDLSYPPDRFDAVIATNVVFLQRDPARAVRGLARVCKPGGLVAMLNPSPQMSAATAIAHADRQGLTGFDRVSFINWSNVAEHNHRFSAEQITELFTAAGLVEITIEPKIAGLVFFAKARKADRVTA